jgi:hypothetical protein
VCYPPQRGRLPTCYSPVRHCTHRPKPTFSFDLHVLGTPPAFVLSQDQTLQFNWLEGEKSPYFSKKRQMSATSSHPHYSVLKDPKESHIRLRVSQFFDYRYMRFLCQEKKQPICIFLSPFFPSLHGSGPGTSGRLVSPCLPPVDPRSFGTFLTISFRIGNVKINMRFTRARPYRLRSLIP